MPGLPDSHPLSRSPLHYRLRKTDSRTGDIVSSKATRSEHYLAIAEFYGRMLVEDIQNPTIPEFVLMHAARRAAHFALVSVRLAERQAERRQAQVVTPAWQGSAPAFSSAISSASLS
jgi:hypothetical protein